MTPKEWFSATKPAPLISTVQWDNGTRLWPVEQIPRRLRLFACAAVRLVWNLLPSEARHAIEASERYADGLATHTDLVATALREGFAGVTASHVAYSAARSASFQHESTRQWPAQEVPFIRPEQAAREAARAWAIHQVGPAPPGSPTSRNWYTAWTAAYQSRKWHKAWTAAYQSACALQADYFRDIFPPPYYVAGRLPSWVTSTVRALARQIAESGDYSAVPILADALQEAGCDSETVLDSCRRPPHTHVRGDWVVDLILGRL
jgi:hypothetical protein